ncbi:hypothetical protein EYF80_057157 [Liparis tanakae]|uniref:Uncharacterized protein n=1 Tax=Liparis tanakae TaxID=230148 RepID=A0A4Z2EWQ7_9TELE|nr:hypothetical protein EYF80_057157 [Liparis tanakae]
MAAGYHDNRRRDTLGPVSLETCLVDRSLLSVGYLQADPTHVVIPTRPRAPAGIADVFLTASALCCGSSGRDSRASPDCVSQVKASPFFMKIKVKRIAG